MKQRVGCLGFLILVGLALFVAAIVRGPSERRVRSDDPGVQAEPAAAATAPQGSPKAETAEFFGSPLTPAGDRTPQGEQQPDDSADLESTSEPPATPAEKLTAEQYVYLAYARLDPSADMGLGGNGVGRLRGTFRVAQVLGPSTMIVDRVSGKYDEVIHSIRIDGVSTAGVVDGERISLDRLTFASCGTVTYKTVLGAPRTIYHAEALDANMLAWARDYVARKDAERLEAARVVWVTDLDAARAARDKVQKAYAQFVKAEAHVAKVAALRDKIRLYEANAGSNASIAQSLARMKAELAALDPMTDEEIAAWRARRSQLQQELRAAERVVDEIKASEPR